MFNSVLYEVLANQENNKSKITIKISTKIKMTHYSPKIVLIFAIFEIQSALSGYDSEICDNVCYDSLLNDRCPPSECQRQCEEDPRAKNCVLVVADFCIRYGPNRQCGCICYHWFAQLNGYFMQTKRNISLSIGSSGFHRSYSPRVTQV